MTIIMWSLICGVSIYQLIGKVKIWYANRPIDTTKV